MPRKHWRVVVTHSDIPTIDPTDRHAVADDDLVRHALVDFEELQVLAAEAHEQLVTDLVDALRFARAGVKARKRGVSDEALKNQIFMENVGRALERAGIAAKRWRKRYDNGGGESFFFRLAREVAEVSGISLPKDLKLSGKRSAGIARHKISPAMQEAQTKAAHTIGPEEVAPGRRRSRTCLRRKKALTTS